MSDLMVSMLAAPPRSPAELSSSLPLSSWVFSSAWDSRDLVSGCCWPPLVCSNFLSPGSAYLLAAMASCPASILGSAQGSRSPLCLLSLASVSCCVSRQGSSPGLSCPAPGRALLASGEYSASSLCSWWGSAALCEVCTRHEHYNQAQCCSY